jgi:hypothetical protein
VLFHVEQVRFSPLGRWMAGLPPSCAGIRDILRSVSSVPRGTGGHLHLPISERLARRPALHTSKAELCWCSTWNRFSPATPCMKRRMILSLFHVEQVKFTPVGRWKAAIPPSRAGIRDILRSVSSVPRGTGEISAPRQMDGWPTARLCWNQRYTKKFSKCSTWNKRSTARADIETASPPYVASQILLVFHVEHVKPLPHRI